jgi:hypothetical protein
MIKEMFETSLDEERLRRLNNSNRCFVLAYRLVTEGVVDGLKLELKDEDKDGFNTTLDTLPDNIKSLVNVALEAQLNGKNYPLDAVLFMTNVSEILAYPGQTGDVYLNLLSAPLPKADNKVLPKTQEFYNRLRQKKTANGRG